MPTFKLQRHSPLTDQIKYLTFDPSDKKGKDFFKNRDDSYKNESANLFNRVFNSFEPNYDYVAYLYQLIIDILPLCKDLNEDNAPIVKAYFSKIAHIAVALGCRDLFDEEGNILPDILDKLNLTKEANILDEQNLKKDSNRLDKFNLKKNPSIKQKIITRRNEIFVNLLNSLLIGGSATLLILLLPTALTTLGLIPSIIIILFSTLLPSIWTLGKYLKKNKNKRNKKNKKQKPYLKYLDTLGSESEKSNNELESDQKNNFSSNFSLEKRKEKFYNNVKQKLLGGYFTNIFPGKLHWDLIALVSEEISAALDGSQLQNEEQEEYTKKLSAIQEVIFSEFSEIHKDIENGSTIIDKGFVEDWTACLTRISPPQNTSHILNAISEKSTESTKKLSECIEDFVKETIPKFNFSQFNKEPIHQILEKLTELQKLNLYFHIKKNAPNLLKNLELQLNDRNDPNSCLRDRIKRHFENNPATNEKIQKYHAPYQGRLPTAASQHKENQRSNYTAAGVGSSNTHITRRIKV